MGSPVGSEFNQPNGLLAALLPYHLLVQPEVALTRSITWLLGLEGAAGGLDDLVRRSGLEPEADGRWCTEVVGEDGDRTDLEYRWAGPAATRVVVEAKIGHTLTVEQVAAYRTRLSGGRGLLVILVPEARRWEADRVIKTLKRSADYPELSEGGPIGLDVWTYDDVTSELEKHLPGNPDVAQFKGLVQACRALDIFPLTAAELLNDNPSRRDDVWRVVDSASWGLFGENLPSGSDGSLEQRRYVSLAPYSVAMAVGVGRKTIPPTDHAVPWAWLRVPDQPDVSAIALEVLEASSPGEVTRDQGEIWVPLHVPTERPGSVMIEKVREEIESIRTRLRDGVDQAWAVLDPVDPSLRLALSKVLGMQPIAPEDLLDDSATRTEDIELIVDEAVRPLYGGRLYPTLSDTDYRRNRYLRIAPLDTHLSTSIGRRAPATDGRGQPWSWLRVHQVTADVEAAFAALESLAPGRVALDDNGRAIPLNIPANVDGPTMLRSVHDEIVTSMAAIRQAILRHHSGSPADTQHGQPL